MENNIRFRNHASVILEKSLKTIGTIFAIFFFNFISDAGETGINGEDIVWLVGGIIVFCGLVLGYQLLIWAKTYILIEENVLVVERNTINKKRNTIGLKNISNVNLEQNLLEMLLGTCKVKLDTNSLSTADQTDVNIVLKKADAERFRILVLAKAEGRDIEEISLTEVTQVEIDAGENLDKNTNRIAGRSKDIILHGLFSIRIWMIVLLVAIMVIQITMIIDLGTEALGESILEILASLFVAFYFVFIILWRIVKEFIKYLNFHVERKKDKVYLSYGYFKKVAYSVPVDKINAIKLTQTPLARMCKRYMVEIINVGMDDDEKEENTFFLPYNKLETIQNQLHMLLPEFDGALEIKEEKQPAVIWLLSIPWCILYFVIAAVAYFFAVTYITDVETRSIFILVYILCTVLLMVAYLIGKLAGFLTKAIKVDEKFLKIVDGAFSKRTLFVKYDKIQFVTGRQCVIAKHFKIQHGTIFLLASLKNRVHALPYFKENDMEQLKNQLI